MNVALYSLCLFPLFAVARSSSSPPASVELPSQLSSASIAVAGEIEAKLQLRDAAMQP